MKIHVGSENPVKIDAVREAFLLYDLFKDADIEGVGTDSGVAEQPTSLKETVLGAQNRARNAFLDCDWSVGIESGLVEVPHTQSGYLDLTAIALYDGKNFHMGLSPAIELPKRVVDKIIDEKKDANTAFNEMGFTENKQIGRSEGFVGLLTGGRSNRKEYMKQGVIMAMAHVEYGNS